MKKSDNPFLKADWTSDSLEATWDIVSKIATKEYGLEYYKPSFEVVGFEDMLHIYTGSLPIMYDHWSFGKAYTQLHKQYMNDRMGVAYEVVFNTSPALCYLLEHNSPTMQGLVMAHASVGHSSFFKNNVLFKEMTNAATIIPFLKNAKQFISECEEKYGSLDVESVLDACHALSYYAIDRKPTRNKTNKEKEALRVQRAEDRDRDYNVSVDTIDLVDPQDKPQAVYNRLHEENILKFIAKHSPSLKQWERDIINIYCKIQQYLYPQMQTKLMNEGFASFWHHTIMHNLGDKGLIPPGNMIEFMHSHCSVLRQPDFDERGYYGINPYKLGYEIFNDIRRICTEPTEEDKEWFPDLVNTDWVKAVKFAAYNFNDSSFIMQYLSPKLIRDFKLFIVEDDANEDNMNISDIHDDEGYKQIRSKLSKAYSFGERLPDLYIEGWDSRKSRTLFLVFQEKDEVELNLDSGDEVVRHIKDLWRFPINFKYKHTNGMTEEGIG